MSIKEITKGRKGARANKEPHWKKRKVLFVGLARERRVRRFKKREATRPHPACCLVSHSKTD